MFSLSHCISQFLLHKSEGGSQSFGHAGNPWRDKSKCSDTVMAGWTNIKVVKVKISESQ